MRYLLLLSLLSIFTYANISELKKYIYKVETKSAVFNSVAIEKNKLITAYHGIDNVRSVNLSQNNIKLSASVDKTLIDKDLATLSTKGPLKYISFSKTIPETGNVVDIVSYDNFITSKIYNIQDGELIFNFAVAPGVSGSGVFFNNKLIGIISKVDILTNRTFATIVQSTTKIDKKHPMEKTPSTKTDNYDTSYCSDPEQLETWERLIQSDNLSIHKLHALFLGLCQKVNNKELTTDEAQVIFETTQQNMQK